MSDVAAAPLAAPGQGRGLWDVVRHRYLLRLVVRKDIQVRYRGSWLGIVWSYIKPAVQFGAFYLAIGVFLGLNKGFTNYAIYLFSGIMVMNFFTESFSNAARSVVGNGGLIKKIYIPRMLFPVATIWVAIVHFIPGLVVLLGACLLVGWTPSLLHIAAIGAGFAIVAIFALGLGLIFATADVFFRDAENFVDLIAMVATWLSPILYMWTMVEREAPALMGVYLANPLTVAVELFHFGFWQPTALDAPTYWTPPPHLFSFWTPVALGISLGMVLLGQWVFRQFESKFAQEL